MGHRSEPPRTGLVQAPPEPVTARIDTERNPPLFAIDVHGMGERPEPEIQSSERAADASQDRALRPLERLASFRFAYLAIFGFLLAYVFTVEGLEEVLRDHFTEVTSEAVRFEPGTASIHEQIRSRIAERIHGSSWVKYGQVRVRPLVLAADGRTALYAGIPIPPLPGDAATPESLLPAAVNVEVSVPHNALLANGILIFYAALLITTLAIYTRRLAAWEERDLRQLTAARDTLAKRTHEIEHELGDVRSRLDEIEPEHELYAEEIDTLATERSHLLAQLAQVEDRERELREQSASTRELAEERRALEELLEEASSELSDKESEIEELRSQVRRSHKGRPARENELIERRFRTLYKQVEIDDHAIDGLISLRDESLKLRAEESIKRLSEDPDQTIVRRKVGGLPPHLSIFELGFAGRGRVYYTKGKTRRVRVIAVGAKNTQNADLDYIARLPKDF